MDYREGDNVPFHIPLVIGHRSSAGLKKSLTSQATRLKMHFAEQTLYFTSRYERNGRRTRKSKTPRQATARSSCTESDPPCKCQKFVSRMLATQIAHMPVRQQNGLHPIGKKV